MCDQNFWTSSSYSKARKAIKGVLKSTLRNPLKQTLNYFSGIKFLLHQIFKYSHSSPMSSTSSIQSCPTLCDPMDCSTPSFPVHHQLPDLAQTHVHWVSDAIQPPYPLSSPSPPAFNLSQHQGLFFSAHIPSNISLVTLSVDSENKNVFNNLMNVRLRIQFCVIG